MLFCSVPFATRNSSEHVADGRLMGLSSVFEWFNMKKQEKSIESYSITQTTLEQIFVHLAGEDEDSSGENSESSFSTNL
jgi:hypothetical protein